MSFSSSRFKLNKNIYRVLAIWRKLTCWAKRNDFFSGTRQYHRYYQPVIDTFLNAWKPRKWCTPIFSIYHIYCWRSLTSHLTSFTGYSFWVLYIHFEVEQFVTWVFISLFTFLVILTAYWHALFLGYDCTHISSLSTKKVSSTDNFIDLFDF